MNARATLRALVVASVVATACSDPTESPLPTFSVSPSTQWSGGTITLRSPYFVNRDPIPIVTVGAETLVVSRQDDSTVVSTVPLGPSGPVTLSLARGSRRDSLAVVQRVGLREHLMLLVALDGELHATDSSGTPIVLGGYGHGTVARQPVLRVRVSVPTFEVLTPLREPSNGIYGMAPSATPGTFTVRDSTDSLRLATLLVNNPSVLGTVPWAGTGFTRQVSLLSPGIWLFTGSHQTYTRAEADSCCAYRATVQAESPWSVYMSPRGDRTTLAAYVPSPGHGVPVFDNSTGAVAFELPFGSTEAATFSPDGSTMYVAGGRDLRSDTLIAVDATSGALLLPKVPLPAGFNAMGLAYRGTGGGQLLVGAASTTSLALLVYRATTLELLGILPTGDDCGAFPQTGSCLEGVVTVDDAQHAAYMLLPGSPAPLWSFDLLDSP